MDDSDELTAPPAPSISSSSKGPPSSGSSSDGGSGDWTCNDCNNVNFARRTSCNRCHKSRGPTRSSEGGSSSSSSSRKRKLGHEIGKAAAEKSRGLFSADDWQCNKCGNVNWARRQSCNVCNAPKFGEVEERTGFGGGYNDRGVVEYKEHEESDDEYDEFGRRKRKKSTGSNSERDRDRPVVVATVDDNNKQQSVKKDRNATTTTTTISAVSNSSKSKVIEKETAEEDDEEEEDEEEDDDDGDLSKYDLSDWGDVPAVAPNKSTNDKPNTSKLRRSRSRSPY